MQRRQSGTLLRTLLPALMVLGACGDDPVAVVIDDEEPRPTLVGTVIASGAFDVTPVPIPTIGDPNFLIAHRFVGSLPANLDTTAGKLLVLSVREVLNALPCPTVIFITECATMVVLELDGPELGRRPGRLTVSMPDPVTFYPWGDFELRPQAEPT